MKLGRVKVWIGMAAGVGMFLFPGALLQVHAQGAREAMLVSSQGEVMVRLAEGQWKPAESGMILEEKDEIRTGQGAFAELLLDGGETARVELKENSHFRVNILQQDEQTADKFTVLDLALGKVLVHAERLQGNSKFEVRTPTSTAGIEGTVFEVSVSEDDKPSAS